jgi:hypothetical protein
MDIATLTEMVLERLKPYVQEIVSEQFASVGIIPARSVVVRCGQRAMDMASEAMPAALADIARSFLSEKEIEDEARTVLAKAVWRACVEAAEYERYNPPFGHGARYSVCEGRDN